MVISRGGPWSVCSHEDDEDDDPAEEDDPSGQCDEDEVTCGSGHIAMHGSSYYGPGCPLADGAG